MKQKQVSITTPDVRIPVECKNTLEALQSEVVMTKVALVIEYRREHTLPNAKNARMCALILDRQRKRNHISVPREQTCRISYCPTRWTN